MDKGENIPLIQRFIWDDEFVNCHLKRYHGDGSLIFKVQLFSMQSKIIIYYVRAPLSCLFLRNVSILLYTALIRKRICSSFLFGLLAFCVKVF